MITPRMVPVCIKSTLLRLGLALALLTSHLGAALASVVAVSLPGAGVYSYSDVGSPENTTFDVASPPGSTLIGVGWNVTLEAFDPSWLSELSLTISNSDGSAFVTIRPAAQDDTPGSGSYAGKLDLEFFGLDFQVQPGPFVKFEFWEQFDDMPGQADGHWASGSIDLFFRESAAVPEPATTTLIIIGMLGLVIQGTRRRALHFARLRNS